MHSRELVKLTEARIVAASGEARKIRHASGLSCDQVGGAVGVSGVTIMRWELGQRKPSGPPAIRYYDLLGRLRKATTQ
jgi:DNA-binding transcriptional regulator YiaG